MIHKTVSSWWKHTGYLSGAGVVCALCTLLISTSLNPAVVVIAYITATAYLGRMFFDKFRIDFLLIMLAWLYVALTFGQRH